MEKVKTIASIKNDIEKHVGQKVTLKANGGRKKILVNDGIIESVYSSIFVIRLKNDTQRTVTYSYSDVLTKTVQLVFPTII
ncbi:MAG: hypothetical protein LLF98_10020 [Clostridium sp.]|uniref:Veg family protein n=1 Tax=Clostridium sp. TaxID=1506 RepID=UPI0025C3DD92|nr:Veg family protein [Clostridium sp.]MCE5221574.1 hypothetical protein [Clostridium sp.]